MKECEKNNNNRNMIKTQQEVFLTRKKSSFWIASPSLLCESFINVYIRSSPLPSYKEYIITGSRRWQPSKARNDWTRETNVRVMITWMNQRHALQPVVLPSDRKVPFICWLFYTSNILNNEFFPTHTHTYIHTYKCTYIQSEG